MEEFQFFELVAIKKTILTNQIIKKVTYSTTSDVFIVELDTPWAECGARYEIKERIRLELMNFNSLEEYVTHHNTGRRINEQRTAIEWLNLSVAKYHSDTVRLFSLFPDQNVNLWSMLVSGLVQQPAEFRGNWHSIYQLHNERNVSKIMNHMLEYWNVESIELTSPVRRIVIDASYKTNKYNNALIDMTIRWGREDEKFLMTEATWGYHIKDTFDYPHYHIFKKPEALIPFLVYCLKRTWDAIRIAQNNSMHNVPKRINYGLILNNVPPQLNQDVLIKLTALLVYPSLVVNSDQPFHVVLPKILSKIDSWNFSDPRFKRYKWHKIPINAIQIQLMEKYGINYDEERTWRPDFVDNQEEVNGVLTPVVRLRQVPRGQRILDTPDMIVSYLKKVVHRSEVEFLHTVPYSVAEQKGYDFLELPPVDNDIYTTINRTKVKFPLGHIDQYMYLRTKLQQTSVAKLFEDALFSDAFDETITGCVLSSYANGTRIAGRISVEEGDIDITYENIVSPADKYITTSPERFFMTVQVMKYIAQFLSIDVLGSDALQLERKQRVLFINFEERMMDITNLFFNWQIIYACHNPGKLGGYTHLDGLLVNVNANVVFWRMDGRHNSVGDIIKVLKMIANTHGIIFILTLEYWNPNVLYPGLRDYFTVTARISHGLGSPVNDFGLIPNLTLVLGNPTQVTDEYQFNVYGYNSDVTMQEYLDVLRNMIYHNANYYTDPGLSTTLQDTLDIGHLTVGTSFSLFGSIALESAIVGTACSLSEDVEMRKYKRDHTDQLSAKGTISYKSKAIVERRQGLYLDTTLSADTRLEYSEDILMHESINTISASELITQGLKHLIRGLRTEEIAGSLNNNLLDLGAAEYVNIDLTKKTYVGVDQTAVPVLNLPDTEMLTMEIPINPTVPPAQNEFTILINNFVDSHDVTCINALTFLSLDKLPAGGLYENMYNLAVRDTLLNNLQTYITKFPSSTIYFNFPYCDVSTYFTCRKIIPIENKSREADPGDDDNAPVDAFTRFIGKFGTHGFVPMLNEDEVEAMLEDITTRFNRQPKIRVPSISQQNQICTHLNYAVPTTCNLWNVDLSLLSPVCYF